MSNLDIRKVCVDGQAVYEDGKFKYFIPDTIRHVKDLKKSTIAVGSKVLYYKKYSGYFGTGEWHSLNMDLFLKVGTAVDFSVDGYVWIRYGYDKVVRFQAKHVRLATAPEIEKELELMTQRDARSRVENEDSLDESFSSEDLSICSSCEKSGDSSSGNNNCSTSNCVKPTIKKQEVRSNKRSRKQLRK